MIVGVDVSSRRIDLAWIENGKPQRWHQQLDSKAHLIDRLREIRIVWPNYGTGENPGVDVTDIAIEYPFAVQKPAVAALMATVGVITRQAPPWARVAWPSSGELRAAIGAKNNKSDAWNQLLHGTDWPHDTYADLRDNWNEHELDALVACLGWTAILAAQEDDAT